MWSRNQNDRLMCQRFQKSRIFRVEKRLIEVLRGAEAEQTAEANGKGAVTGKVEEQVQRVHIHVPCRGERPDLLIQRLDTVRADERGDDELVQKALKDALHRRVEIIKEFCPSANTRPVLPEAPVTIDRARGDRGEEKEERKVLRRVQRLDQLVVNAEDHIQRPKGDIRDPQKPNLLSVGRIGSTFWSASGRIDNASAA